MRRRRVSFSSDPRWTALKRAGLAVAAALVLLVAALWYWDGDSPDDTPSPPPVPEQGAPAQPQASTASTPSPAVAGDLAADAAPKDAVPLLEDIPAPMGVAPVPGLAAQPAAVPPPPDDSLHAVKAAAPAEAPAVPPPSLQDGYFVQLGVFDATDNASRLLDNTMALGLPAHLQTRVVVGPFSNKREAEAARVRLKEFAEGIVLPPKHGGAKASGKPKAKSRQRAR